MNFRFTNRTGGVSTGAFASLNLGSHVGDQLSDVLRNRQIISESLGSIQFMKQVHGERIAIIESTVDDEPTADALITGIPGINLAVQVADCIPLLLSSPEAVAAVHVGRKGLVNDISKKTLDVMRHMGSTSIQAFIGPSICGRCYEVSEDIYSQVVALHPRSASRTSLQKYALDLPAALREVLDSEGVEIIDHTICTVENHDLFSFRRDGVTGRQAGFISL